MSSSFPQTQIPPRTYLTDDVKFPFCKGCGHTSVIRRLNDALVKLDLSPSDVALVTDIGCIGLADSLFQNLHTVHTTHGRSTAFATGISLADSVLAQGKLKTIVLIGDGGAMIGLQHLVHAAMLNVDVTVIICNNFVYGMTGGQGSGLTPECFVTATTPGGNIVPPVDICRILQNSNAPYVSRMLATDPELTEVLEESIAYSGFAAVEVLELCTEFAVPHNALTGTKLSELARNNGWQLWNVARDLTRQTFADRYRQNGRSTIAREEVRNGRREAQRSPLGHPLSVVVAGSAGERVQSSAALICQLALDSGLHVTQKNDNPVTQGSGFSLSELRMSPRPIGFTGIEHPDLVLVTSDVGAREIRSQGWLGKLDKASLVFVDESLDGDWSDPRMRRAPFRKVFGQKAAALGGLVYLLCRRKVVESKQAIALVLQRYGEESALALAKGMKEMEGLAIHR